jgi:hypothetical protein
MVFEPIYLLSVTMIFCFGGAEQKSAADASHGLSRTGRCNGIQWPRSTVSEPEGAGVLGQTWKKTAPSQYAQATIISSPSTCATGQSAYPQSSLR